MKRKYMCMCSCHCLSYPVSLSRSLLDATTPNTTDRPRVISLSPLTRTQIFIHAQPSQCTAWHQQSCATRTRPCGVFRDLEKMSQMISSLVPCFLYRTINATSCSTFKKGTNITFHLHLGFTLPLERIAYGKNILYTSSFSEYV